MRATRISKVIVKCTVVCVMSLFVGLFLSILQVIMREREPSLLGTLKEIWGFLQQNIPLCEDRVVSNFPCPCPY